MIPARSRRRHVILHSSTLVVLQSMSRSMFSVATVLCCGFLVHEVCSRDSSCVVASVNCCPDPCAVQSKLLMSWLVRRVSWMTFPSGTCFRVGGGFFTEGWRVSSVFNDVVSLVLRNARFIISREKFVVRSACLCAPSFVL